MSNWQVVKPVEPGDGLVGLILQGLQEGWGEQHEKARYLCETAPALLAALKMYVKLDNDRRSGCEIAPEDWAECHQAASAAIAKAEGPQT